MSIILNVDKAWEDLQSFVVDYPQFKNRVPESKYTVYDDGMGGANAMLANLLKNPETGKYEMPKDCSIQ